VLIRWLQLAEVGLYLIHPCIIVAVCFSYLTSGVSSVSAGSTFRYCFLQLSNFALGSVKTAMASVSNRSTVHERIVSALSLQIRGDM